MAGRLSRLDHIYRSLLLTKFYTRGWGNPRHLEQIIKYFWSCNVALSHPIMSRLRKAVGTRETNAQLLSTPTSVIQITKQETRDEAILLTGNSLLLLILVVTGHFLSQDSSSLQF